MKIFQTSVTRFEAISCILVWTEQIDSFYYESRTMNLRTKLLLMTQQIMPHYKGLRTEGIIGITNLCTSDVHLRQTVRNPLSSIISHKLCEY